MTNIETQLTAAMEKFAKWRSVFAGWQLGTRLKTDPECQAVKDHREVTIFLRAEVNALRALMIRSGIFTQEQLQLQLMDEIEALEKAYEKKFPGFKSSSIGMDVDVQQGAETTKGWRP